MPENLFLSDDTDLRSRILAELNGGAMLGIFGMKVSFPDAVTVRCTIDQIRPEFRGGLRSTAVNGGILAALFDLALGMPGLTRHPDQASGTMNLNLNYMRAVRGDRVVAEGWIERAGKGVIFTAARIVDENNTVCATATGLVRLLG